MKKKILSIFIIMIMMCINMISVNASENISSNENLPVYNNLYLNANGGIISVLINRHGNTNISNKESRIFSVLENENIGEFIEKEGYTIKGITKTGKILDSWKLYKLGPLEIVEIEIGKQLELKENEMAFLAYRAGTEEGMTIEGYNLYKDCVLIDENVKTEEIMNMNMETAFYAVANWKDSVEVVVDSKVQENLKNETSNIVKAIENGTLKEDVVSKKTAENVKKAVEEGHEITTKLVVNPVEETFIEKAEKEVIQAEVEKELGKEANVQYLDISIVLMANDNELGTIEEAEKEISITIEVPNNMKSDDAEYVIIRNHNGVIDVLPTTLNSDGTITFKTNRFSTYALAYSGVEEEEVSVTTSRIAGANRFETSYKIADELKKSLSVEKFDTIILANALNFADALSGSYLATEKNAPILLVNTYDLNGMHTYIKNNLKKDGTIYVLGGTSAVADGSIKGLDKDYKIKRLGGANRFETNLLILKEAGVTNQDLLICTAGTFADSLSASATNKPLLLVFGNALTKEQKEFLKTATGKRYIIGGTGAVSEKIAKEIGEHKRIAGSNRCVTSTLIAEEFFGNPKSVVVASALAFPDGLCGGALAYQLNSPLILTAAGFEDSATAYVAAKNVKNGYALGGKAVLTDKTVDKIMSH